MDRVKDGVANLIANFLSFYFMCLPHRKQKGETGSIKGEPFKSVGLELLEEEDISPPSLVPESNCCSAEDVGELPVAWDREELPATCDTEDLLALPLAVQPGEMDDDPNAQLLQEGEVGSSPAEPQN